MEQITGDSRGQRRSAEAEMLNWRSAVAFVLAWLCAVNSHATIVRYSTVLGNVDVRLYDSATPLSVANFLNYANSDRYDGTFIHRKINNFVVQGGGFTYDADTNTAPEVESDDPVLNEFGISNLRGTIAYAKVGPPDGQPATPETINSATNEWFFNLVDNSGAPPLGLNFQNGGFTVFGHVLGNGMNVIDAIAALPSADLDGTFAHTFDSVPLRAGTGLAQRLVFINDISTRNLPAGDYNFDGTVDMADFVVWKADYGSKIKAEADGNGNGRVDAADYTIWRNTFGQTSGPGSGAGGPDASTVPEPGTLLFAALASGFAVLVARRRRMEY